MPLWGVAQAFLGPVNAMSFPIEMEQLWSPRTQAAKLLERARSNPFGTKSSFVRKKPIPSSNLRQRLVWMIFADEQAAFLDTPLHPSRVAFRCQPGWTGMSFLSQLAGNLGVFVQKRQHLITAGGWCADNSANCPKLSVAFESAHAWGVD